MKKRRGFSKEARARFARNAPGWTLERIPHGDQLNAIARNRPAGTAAAPYAMPVPSSIPPDFLSRLIRGRDLGDVPPSELRNICLLLAWHIAHLGPLVKAGKKLARARAVSASTAPSRTTLNRAAIEREIRAILNDPAKAAWPGKTIAAEIHARIERSDVPIIRRDEYTVKTIYRIVRELMAKIRPAS